MPTYEYKCECGTRFERFLPLAQYAEPQICECGARAEKIFTSVRVMGDLPPYISPVTGREIRGRREREEDLKRSGCRPYEAGERQAAARKRAEIEKAFDARVEETVEREFEALPSRKKEKLAAEIEGGMTCEVTRVTPVRATKPIVQEIVK
jgi:putative FmdB family regulatory protein